MAPPQDTLAVTVTDRANHAVWSASVKWGAITPTIMVENVKKMWYSIAVEESKDESEQSDNEQSDDIVPVISLNNDRNNNLLTQILTDSDDMESENYD